MTGRLVDLMENVSIDGSLVHDANIVATMLAHGVDRLLTHNTGDFARFSHLITVLSLS